MVASFSLSRRAALLAPAGLALAPVSAGAQPAAADPFERLRERWVAMLTGGPDLEVTSPPYAAIVQGVADNARGWWTAMADPRGRPASLWTDPASGLAEYNTRVTADRLRVMALAWATPGSDLTADPKLKADLVEGLTWLEARRYSIRIERFGNWWEWEIGIPTALTDLVLLMQPVLRVERPDLMRRLIAAIDRFTHAADVGTAANTVWRSHVVALNAIAARDVKQLKSARQAFPPTFEDATHGDGFHADGSFIQHDEFAYTGGYGRDMLFRSALLIHLLDGSPWALAASEWSKLKARINTAYAPLMYRGALMDMVRGRNISRAALSDIKSGQQMIHALLYLSQVEGGRDLKVTAKSWIAAQSNLYDVFTYDPKLPAYWLTPFTAQLISAAIRDKAVPVRAEPVGCTVYPAMERAVFRSGDVAVAVAMNSARIVNYESANGENLEGWYTGQGMTYVYQQGHENYAGDVWPTIDPYRLPGVTLDRRPRAPAAVTARNTSDAVGGAGLDTCAALGMRIETDGGSLKATKSWFFADGYVVALGAGISSDSDYAVETVIENRDLRAPEARLVVDGEPRLTAPGRVETFERATWLHLDGYGGVALPGGATVQALRETREGTWSRINKQGASPTDLRRRTYASFWFDHGVRPAAASYAYVLLPGATAAQTRVFAAATVLDNQPHVQGVRLLTKTGQVHAANFWTRNRAQSGVFVANDIVSVVVKVDAGRIEVALADPTQTHDQPIEVELALAGRAVVSNDPALAVTLQGKTIRLSFDPRGLYGRAARAVVTSVS
ncbi:polysaccharide lyase 8 family protein [soil metagenome]